MTQRARLCSTARESIAQHEVTVIDSAPLRELNRPLSFCFGPRRNSMSPAFDRLHRNLSIDRDFQTDAVFGDVRGQRQVGDGRVVRQGFDLPLAVRCLAVNVGCDDPIVFEGLHIPYAHVFAWRLNACVDPDQTSAPVAICQRLPAVRKRLPLRRYGMFGTGLHRIAIIRHSEAFEPGGFGRLRFRCTGTRWLKPRSDHERQHQLVVAIDLRDRVHVAQGHIDGMAWYEVCDLLCEHVGTVLLE